MSFGAATDAGHPTHLARPELRIGPAVRGRAIYAWLKTVDREPEPILKRPVAQVTARTVSRTRITKRLRVIRTTLKRAERDLRRLGPLVREAEQAAKRSTKNPRRKLRLSPARRRSLKLQGRYMGYMRQLKPKQKARVKAVKEKSGFPAAIAVARRMVAGSSTS